LTTTINIRWFGVDGDADVLGPGVFGVGLGAATETKFGNNCSFTRTRKMRK
jgi:hypothetical protein